MTAVKVSGPRFARLRDVCRDNSGVSAMEFGLVLPLLIFLGLGGLEVANMAIAHSRINQIAISLADNASRMKQRVIGANPQFREYDADQALTAAEKQGGDLKLEANGRIILSSLQLNADNGQWIAWQRCKGQATGYASAYGIEGKGATGTAFKGIGPGSDENKLKAGDKAAIMVAEVVYEYKPLIVDTIFDKMTIRKYAAVYVRDDRDLTQIYPTAGITAGTCVVPPA